MSVGKHERKVRAYFKNHKTAMSPYRRMAPFLDEIIKKLGGAHHYQITLQFVKRYLTKSPQAMLFGKRSGKSYIMDAYAEIARIRAEKKKAKKEGRG